MDSLQRTIGEVDAFAGHTLTTISVLSEQKMGFSGACVMDVECKWEPTGPPKRLFVKNIVLDYLPEEENARAKALRNRQSYKNEIAVVQTFLPLLRERAGLQAPTTYRIIRTEGGAPDPSAAAPAQSHESYLFISQSLSDTAEQLPVYNLDQCQAVLCWMARMHALYWGARPAQDGRMDPHSVSTAGVWNQGTHLALPKRPHKEVDSMVGIWEAFCTAFGWSDLNEVGQRLADAAERVSQHLSVYSEANAGRVTLVHGDFKPGNIFFHRKHQASSCSNSNSNSSNGRRVAPTSGSGMLPAADDTDSSAAVQVIDFQWTGYGMAVTDAAYFLAMAPSDELLDTLDVEADYIEPYYAALCAAYIRYHDGEALPYTLLQCKQDFRYAVLDFVRWVVPGRLGGETPAKYAARQAQLPWDLNMGAYKRSPKMMRFLLDRVVDYLPFTAATAGDVEDAR